MDYQRAGGLFLFVGQQIDGAEGMGAGWAGLYCGSVRMHHRMAMGHDVSGAGRGVGKLVLNTLRPAHRGCGLRHEQNEQQ
jgi:hypothetical protein